MYVKGYSGCNAEDYYLREKEVYTYLHIHTYIHTHIHAYIHTHTHTHTHAYTHTTHPCIYTHIHLLHPLITPVYHSILTIPAQTLLEL